ncbi:MAG TPA: MerR family transcriptional regulator, partial [Acidimicrobiia bacterium]|nr:MerR family transcriptional regulator [Acidimicrobiia bacterium]
RLSGCGPTRLDAWRRIGLVTPTADAESSGPGAPSYSFRDLVALRMVTALLDEGVPMARIRRAVRALLQAGDDIASLSLVSGGDTVFACRDDGQVLDALRNGQLALFVSVDQFSRDVDADVRRFAAERATFVDVISARG